MTSRRSSNAEKTEARRELNVGDLRRINQLVSEAEKRPRIDPEHNLIEHSKRNGVPASEEGISPSVMSSVSKADSNETPGSSAQIKDNVSSSSNSVEATSASVSNTLEHGEYNDQHAIEQEFSWKKPDEPVEVSDSIGRWTKHEHEQFLKGLRAVGKNWRVIAGEYVTGRTEQQIRTHAAGYFEKISKLPMMGGINAPKRTIGSTDSVAKSTMLLNNSAASGIEGSSGGATPFDNLMEAAEKIVVPSGRRTIFSPPVPPPPAPHQASQPPSVPAVLPAVVPGEIVHPLQLPSNPAAESGLTFPNPEAVAHYNEYMLSLAAQYYQMAALYQPPAGLMGVSPPAASIVAQSASAAAAAVAAAPARVFPFVGPSPAVPLMAPAALAALKGSGGGSVGLVPQAGSGIMRIPTLERTGSFTPNPLLGALSGVGVGVGRPSVATVSADALEASSALQRPAVLGTVSAPARVPLLPNLDSIIASAVSVALNQYLPRMLNNPASALQHGAFTHGGNGGGEKMKIQFATSLERSPLEVAAQAAANAARAAATAATAATATTTTTTGLSLIPELPVSPSSSSQHSGGGGSAVFDWNDRKRSRDENDDVSEDEVYGDEAGDEEEEEEQEEAEGEGEFMAVNVVNSTAALNASVGISFNGPAKKKPKTPQELVEWKDKQRKKQQETLAQEQEKRRRQRERETQKEQQRLVRMMVTGSMTGQSQGAQEQLLLQQQQQYVVPTVLPQIAAEILSNMGK